jgi:hypothetical protein
VTLGHAGTLEEVKGVLSLGQVEVVRRACDGDPQEVMEIAEVRHGKLGVKTLGDALQ